MFKLNIGSISSSSLSKIPEIEENIFFLLIVSFHNAIVEPLNLNIFSLLKSKLLNLPSFSISIFFFENLNKGFFSLKTEKTISYFYLIVRLQNTKQFQYYWNEFDK